MTPDTGMDNANGDQNIDNAVVAQAVAAAIDEIYQRTGQDSILVTHSQGGLPGWEVPRYTDHVAAIVAIEPGGAPTVDSEAYNAFWSRRSPSPSTTATTSARSSPTYLLLQCGL